MDRSVLQSEYLGDLVKFGAEFGIGTGVEERMT
jgi:hypothetical protein